MEEKSCEKCGAWASELWKTDGIKVCSACLKEWIMQEPKAMLDALLSNVDIGVIAEWMDVEKARDWQCGLTE